MAAPLVNCLEGATDKIVKMDVGGHYLAFGALDNALYVADLDEFRVTYRFEFSDTVTWVSFYSDELLIASSLDGTVAYFYLEGGEFHQKLSYKCSQIAKFIVHRRKIYAISEDSLVYVLDGKNLQILNVLNVEGIADAVVVNSDYIAFAGRQLQLYNVRTGEISDRYERAGRDFVSVGLLDELVIAGADDGGFLSFSVRGGKLSKNQADFEGGGQQIFDIYQVTVNYYSMLFLACASALISLERNMALRYENGLNTAVTIVRQHRQNVICGCADGSIIVFSALSGEKVCSFEAVVQENDRGEEEQIPVNDLLVFCDRLFVTGDKFVYVYSLDFGEIAQKQKQLEEESLPTDAEDAANAIEQNAA